MFPQPPLHISDNDHSGAMPFKKRRHDIMAQCSGPIVLLAPKLGPNHHHAWAHCYQPVYQDSYFLYLTGINQTGIAMILDPDHHRQFLFLPPHDPHHVFWNGHQFSYQDPKTHEFLTRMGFTDICHINDLRPTLMSFGDTTWHLHLESIGKKIRKNEAFNLKRWLSRTFKKSFKYKNICDLSWEQRLTHDADAINCMTIAAKKTHHAFCKTLEHPFDSETMLSGQLIGELLKETPYGLSFSPIIAGQANAAILHYSNNSAPLLPKDLVLMDFGLRWRSMCTDVSRTIPAGGTYTDLQNRLIGIVLDAQLATIERVQSGVTFDELNAFAWETLENLLDKNFCSKGGKMNRPYKNQPHNIGHFLGIQVHDGDANRNYRSKPLPENSIITIEPGLYGAFEFNGEILHCGIRIEDNLLVTPSGYKNLTNDIPKQCHDIEALLAHAFRR